MKYPYQFEQRMLFLSLKINDAVWLYSGLLYKNL